MLHLNKFHQMVVGSFLNTTEESFCVNELELLGIVWSTSIIFFTVKISH